jgi:hypothetical protein
MAGRLRLKDLAAHYKDAARHAHSLTVAEDMTDIYRRLSEANLGMSGAACHVVPADIRCRLAFDNGRKRFCVHSALFGEQQRHHRRPGSWHSRAQPNLPMTWERFLPRATLDDIEASPGRPRGIRVLYQSA